MWKQSTYDLDWEALIPSDDELGTTGIAGFDNYFSFIDDLIQGHFGWKKPLNYKGKSREIAIHQNNIHHLTISPVKRIEDDIPNYDKGLGKQVIRLRCRFTDDVSTGKDYPSQLWHESWMGITSISKRDGKSG